MDREMKIANENVKSRTLSDVLDNIAVVWKDLGQERKTYIANSLEQDITFDNRRTSDATIDRVEKIEERLDRLEKEPRLLYSWEDRIARINSRRDSFGYC